MKSSHSETEYELKIDVSKSDLEKVFRFFARKVEASDISHKCLPRDYYDTPNFDLDGKGESLRIQYKQGRRGRPGGFEQTYKYERPLKGKKSIKGALVRQECPNAVSSNLPDISSIKDLEAKKNILPIKNKDLVYVFTAVIERRYFELSIGTGKNKGRVELAFDLGALVIHNPDKSEPISEIEIELKSGSDAAIVEIEKKIFQIASTAKVSSKPKSARGCALRRRYPIVK